MYCENCGTPLSGNVTFCRQCGARAQHPTLVLEGSSRGNVDQSTSSVLRAYAGFWKRFAAALVDALVTGVGGVIVGFAVGLPMPNDLTVRELEGFGCLIGLVVGWLYYACFESSPLQATIGKLALSIQVTDLAGHRIGFGRATARHFAKWISTFLLWSLLIVQCVLCLGYSRRTGAHFLAYISEGLMLIGLVMLGLTLRTRALHDMIAGCLVVKR